LSTHYFLSDKSYPVPPDSTQWRAPLPMNRQAASGSSGSTSDAPDISHGDFFTGLTRILSRERYSFLVKALETRSAKQIDPDQIEQIDIFSEKHGAFYHPARVDVQMGGQKTSFVANVAFSEAGNTAIAREFKLLQKLGASHTGEKFLPEVYACEMDPGASAERPISVFLGEWLEGFHEFHLCRSTPDDVPAIRVWDPGSDACFLTRKQANQLYFEATRILTRLYNPETFEQVYPWHHAAGDFVVRMNGSSIEIKLITVRNYAALHVAEEKDPAAILQAMLLFFIGLSMRMRLDRDEGTGELVWAEANAVKPMVDGFLLGLAEMDDTPLLPDTPLRCLVYFISTFSRDDFIEMTHDHGAVGIGNTSEISFIAHHAEKHFREVYQVLRDWRL
jgi:hypothetical protein